MNQKFFALFVNAETYLHIQRVHRVLGNIRKSFHPSRWPNAQKREAKEKRRTLKKARREREKERRKELETPLQWDA